MELCFVSASSKDYALLAKKLDDYYISLVGDVHLRYANVNNPKNMACIIVAYEGKKPIGCGCWKAVDDTTAEVKRIYVEPQYRRRGVATAIIELLENHILASGYTQALLETARTTGDSKALYLSLGYREIPYYGSPAGAENCRCFLKELM
jgi:ribosomal protein S18 acetylase RimI-like enzyme